jgi:hypothetical protein
MATSIHGNRKVFGIQDETTYSGEGRADRVFFVSQSERDALLEYTRGLYLRMGLSPEFIKAKLHAVDTRVLWLHWDERLELENGR